METLYARRQRISLHPLIGEAPRGCKTADVRALNYETRDHAKPYDKNAAWTLLLLSDLPPPVLVMSTEYSEAALAEAAAAIQTPQTYQAGRGEKFLDTLGMYLDILSTASVDSLIQVIRSLPFQGVKQFRRCKMSLDQQPLIWLRIKSLTLSKIAGSWLTCWTKSASYTHSP